MEEREIETPARLFRFFFIRAIVVGVKQYLILAVFSIS